MITNHSYRGREIIYIDEGHKITMDGKINSYIKTPFKATEQEMAKLYEKTRHFEVWYTQKIKYPSNSKIIIISNRS